MRYDSAIAMAVTTPAKTADAAISSAKTMSSRTRGSLRLRDMIAVSYGKLNTGGMNSSRYI
jgi:hypothetical protein